MGQPCTLINWIYAHGIPNCIHFFHSVILSDGHLYIITAGIYTIILCFVYVLEIFVFCTYSHSNQNTGHRNASDDRFDLQTPVTTFVLNDKEVSNSVNIVPCVSFWWHLGAWVYVYRVYSYHQFNFVTKYCLQAVKKIQVHLKIFKNFN